MRTRKTQRKSGTETDRGVSHFGAAAASSQRCEAHPLTRTLNQRNCTNSGDFDRGSKDPDVSRENQAASNALAAKCRQVQLCPASWIKRSLNDSNNQGGTFPFCASQDRIRFKSDVHPQRRLGVSARFWHPGRVS